jgi:hypothetical protein
MNELGGSIPSEIAGATSLGETRNGISSLSFIENLFLMRVLSYRDFEVGEKQYSWIHTSVHWQSCQSKGVVRARQRNDWIHSRGNCQFDQPG